MTGLPVGFLSGIGGGEVLIIFVVFLMLFGAKKLPGIARSLGKSMEEFRRAARDVREEFLNADRDLQTPTPPAYTPTPSSEPSPTATDGGYEYPGGEYGATDGAPAEAAPIEPVTGGAAEAATAPAAEPAPAAESAPSAGPAPAEPGAADTGTPAPGDDGVAAPQVATEPLPAAPAESAPEAAGDAGPAGPGAQDAGEPR